MCSREGGREKWSQKKMEWTTKERRKERKGGRRDGIEEIEGGVC